MNSPRFISLAVALQLLGLVLSGCSESPLGAETTVTEVGTSKMRNAHLFGNGAKFLSRAKVLERYETLMVYTDFLVSYSDLVLDASRVLERYSVEPGVTVKRQYKSSFKGFAMHVDGAHVDRILHVIEFDDDIEWVEPDTRFGIPLSGTSDTKTNNVQILPWGIDYVEGDLSFTLSGDGAGSVDDVDVFVFDSGVNNPDINVVSALDFNGSTGSAVKDKLGHGTHIAGTIGAMDDNAQVVGIAPGIRVHNYKVLDDNGQTNLSTVISAVDAVTDLKLASPDQPMVVNISFGADTGSPEFNALDEAIQKSIEAGVVFVIAAGNERVDVSTVTPARVPEALTVAAHGPEGRHASFSNFGPGIDLYAPGTGIESTTSKDRTTEWYYPTIMSGTSMAAPHVTGTVALGLSLYPDATAAEIHDVVKSATKNDVSRTPGGSGTTKARLSLDLVPFVYGGGSHEDPTAPGGGKVGANDKY